MSLNIDKKTIVLAILSALWAFIPILTSYSANLGEVTLNFVLLFGLFCAVGTLGIFVVLMLIFQSPFASFGACVVGWFGVSASYSVIIGLARLFEVRILFLMTGYCLLLLLLCIGIGYLIKKLIVYYKPNEKFVITMVLILVVVLLVVSVIPIACYSVQLDEANAEQGTNDMVFLIDASLPNPNIYWIHAESMINEKTLEKYWGEETIGFTETLEEKGFVVNQNAEFIVCPHTTYALPAFMCPNYYDIHEEDYLSEYVDREWNPNRKLSGALYSVAQNAYRQENELVTAFEKVNYSTTGIIKITDLYYSGSEYDNNYLYSQNYQACLISDPEIDIVGVAGDTDNQIQFIQYTVYPLYYAGLVPNFWESYQFSSIRIFSPVNIPYDSEVITISQEKIGGSDWLYDEYGGLLNSLSYSLKNTYGQKFIFISPSAAHEEYLYGEDGNHIQKDVEHRLDGYYEQYLLSEKAILMFVEMILENDPNAIIVIQGDHGPHVLFGDYNVQEFYDTFGSDADVIELRNHVLSAVYIPEEYQTENYTEIISNPLNIARYLVNNFVGENYEYI